MNALRVVHLTPTYFGPDSVVGGGERYVANIAQALQVASPCLPRTIEQAVVTIGKENRFLMQNGIPVRILKNENPSPNLMDGVSQYLWREIENFDLVHVHQSLTTFGAYASVICKSMGKPLIMTDLGGGHHPVMTTGRGLDLADGVVSISNFAHSLIAGSYGGRYEVIVGPIDTDTFKPPAKPRKNPKSVICVSRIMPHKGIDRIIRALPEGLSMTMVGSVYHEQYYALLKELAQGKDVTFTHDASDEQLIELYGSSGLFAQGSTGKDVYGTVVRKTELMGLTTLEAMACGLPVVVSDGGSLPEMVPNDTLGRVFKTHDELVGHLEDFRDGRWPRKFSAKAAHEHVEKNHSAMAVGLRLGRLYEDLLGERG
jgi:glycosyltransferase involved in cell wall biosynthesis